MANRIQLNKFRFTLLYTATQQQLTHTRRGPAGPGPPGPCRRRGWLHHGVAVCTTGALSSLQLAPGSEHPGITIMQPCMSQTVVHPLTMMSGFVSMRAGLRLIGSTLRAIIYEDGAGHITCMVCSCVNAFAAAERSVNRSPLQVLKKLQTCTHAAAGIADVKRMGCRRSTCCASCMIMLGCAAHRGKHGIQLHHCFTHVASTFTGQ